jgi:hypothetical protein
MVQNILPINSPIYALYKKSTNVLSKNDDNFGMKSLANIFCFDADLSAYHTRLKSKCTKGQQDSKIEPQIDRTKRKILKQY